MATTVAAISARVTPLGLRFAAARPRCGGSRRLERDRAGVRLVLERLGELRRGGEAVGRELLERGDHRRFDVARNRVTLRWRAGAGLSVSTRATTACAVWPVKGGSPVSIS